MGTVYLGDDLLTGLPVAIKLMHPGLGPDAAALHRFFCEAAAASAISHPGVVKTLHVDVTADGQLYQIMEYVDGLDLATMPNKPPSIPACTCLAATLATPPAAATHAACVHRDHARKTKSVPSLATRPFSDGEQDETHVSHTGGLAPTA